MILPDFEPPMMWLPQASHGLRKTVTGLSLILTGTGTGQERGIP